jgi:hypothetical protein
MAKDLVQEYLTAKAELDDAAHYLVATGQLISRVGRALMRSPPNLIVMDPGQPPQWCSVKPCRSVGQNGRQRTSSRTLSPGTLRPNRRPRTCTARYHRRLSQTFTRRAAAEASQQPSPPILNTKTSYCAAHAAVARGWPVHQTPGRPARACSSAHHDQDKA